jgi:hypothetical protein
VPQPADVLHGSYSNSCMLMTDPPYLVTSVEAFLLPREVVDSDRKWILCERILPVDPSDINVRRWR